MKKLAILIPTLVERKELFDRCNAELMLQINALENTEDVAIISLSDNREETTGEKRNWLYNKAYQEGYKYAASFDDDDLPRENYIQEQLNVANSGMDCGSFKGRIYWNGIPGKPFLHSNIFELAWEDELFYYRPPNHLNCIKLELIHDIKFENKTFGEDMCWAMEIKRLGLLKTEYQINEIIYNYFCGQPKQIL